MKPVVLVTAIGTVASSTIISQLRKTEHYYILGGDIYLKNQVVTSKDVDEFYSFPPAIYELEKYLEFAVSFCEEHKVEYYFATIDEEIVNLSKNREQFNRIGVKLCIPNHNLVMLCHYKDKFSDWIQESIPDIAPKRYRSFNDIVRYPVFIKPVEGRASIGCRRINNKVELDAIIDAGIKEDGYLIQDYIEGNIITVDLIRNAKTGQKKQIQRIEFLRNSSGCGIAVEIIDNAILRNICDEIMEKLDLNGVVNAEFFYDGEKFKIIEINPRFSAGTSFSCLAGCDIVYNAIQIADGEACIFGTPAIGAHLAKRYETYRLD